MWYVRVSGDTKHACRSAEWEWSGRSLVSGDQVRLRVEALDDEEAGELAGAVAGLRSELLGLDVAEVEFPLRESVATEAKGLGQVAGDLVVWLGPAGVGAVLARTADWARRGRRMVEVNVGGDSLKLGQASREQQDRLVEAFIARHSPGS
jgi:hypothetical protein